MPLTLRAASLTLMMGLLTMGLFRALRPKERKGVNLLKPEAGPGGTLRGVSAVALHWEPSGMNPNMCFCPGDFSVVSWSAVPSGPASPYKDPAKGAVKRQGYYE